MSVRNPQRIERLQDLVRDLSREADPGAIVHRFSDAMRTIHGPTASAFVRVHDSVPGGYVLTRLIDEHGEEILSGDDPWLVAPDAQVHEGGFFGDLIASGRAQHLTTISIADDPAVGDRLAHNRSALALPVYEQGEVMGWVVLLHPNPDHFDERDFETMLLRVNVVSGLVQNQRLNRELEEALAWIRDEVDQIAMVQRSLLPAFMPEIEGLDLAARFETYDRAGGDYYDFLPWGGVEGRPERWTWVLADASGHGPAAAVIVAMLHMLLRMLPTPLHNPDVLLSEMNTKLFSCHTCNHFMTAFAACYTPETRELAYAVAGHHPPLLRAPDGTVARLPVDATIPLGIRTEVEAPTSRITLDPGSVLLLYTDGLTDAQNADLETFGEDRLAEALRVAEGDATTILDSIYDAVRRHEAGHPSNDDQSAVVVRVA